MNEKDYQCIWRHRSNDPKTERDLILREKPILQNMNANILEKFEGIKCYTGRSKLTTDLVHEAEN